jgi:hypothetical protein
MNMPLGGSSLPWLQGEELSRLHRMMDYFLLNSQLYRKTKHASAVRSAVRLLVSEPIRWRMKSSRYAFPWELWVAKISEDLVSRRSLVTGQELPAIDAAGAC